MNKKIIVSGCSNCPYLVVWNNGEGNGANSITMGECRHPSYHKELPNPRFDASVFLHYSPQAEREVTGVRAIGTPVSCPLPNDNNEE